MTTVRLGGPRPDVPLLLQLGKKEGISSKSSWKVVLETLAEVAVSTQVPSRGFLQAHLVKQTERGRPPPHQEALPFALDLPPRCASGQMAGTWVMERHQDIVAGLQQASLPLIRYATGLDLGSGNLISHAARGVQHEAQARGRADVQQPEERSGDIGKGLHIQIQLSPQIPRDRGDKPLTWRKPCLPRGSAGGRGPGWRPTGPAGPPAGAACGVARSRVMCCPC